MTTPKKPTVGGIGFRLIKRYCGECSEASGCNPRDPACPFYGLTPSSSQGELRRAIEAECRTCQTEGSPCSLDADYCSLVEYRLTHDPDIAPALALPHPPVKAEIVQPHEKRDELLARILRVTGERDKSVLWTAILWRYGPSVVDYALQALKRKGRVQNPGGYLMAVIKREWSRRNASKT